MRILLDGMGGDHAPLEIVKGAVEAAKEITHTIVIIGDQKKIEAELKKYKYDKKQILIEHASDVIDNCDAPVKAVRTKKESSMVNSGALMAGSLLILGRIQGIDRPAMASIYPILGGQASLLVDAGANAECKPDNLLEFATMGSIYMEKVLGRKNPKVGIVNIGAEETKGTTVTKAAHELLLKSSLNFVGNVEAREIPFGASDVIVCDGFVGNVVLKLTEGMALSVLKKLKETLTAGLKAKLGTVLLYDKIKGLKSEFDYSEYGGAPILGVKGPIVKMHGASNSNAVKNTILKGIPYAEQNVVQTILDSVLELEEIKISE